MPAYIFRYDTATPQDFIPSTHGITNGTVARIHACGNGGKGADADMTGGGGGGGSGEMRGAEFTIADADGIYTYYIPGINEEDTIYFRDPDGMTDIVSAVNGEPGIGQTGGQGGSGGTGALYGYAGAKGGDGSATDDAGGGGASGARDTSAGVAGSDGTTYGGAGGLSGTQFGVAGSGGGGAGGDPNSNGSQGVKYGSGGGGGGKTGGTGADAQPPLMILVWGDMLTSYPEPPFLDGFVEDTLNTSGAWYLLLGS